MKLRILGVALLAGTLLGCTPTGKDESKTTGEISGTESSVPKPSGLVKPTMRADASKGKNAMLLPKAQAALQRGEIDTAITALDELIAADPKNRQGLFLLAAATQAKAETATRAGNTKDSSPLYLKAAEYGKQLRAAYPKLNANEKNLLVSVLYNEACAEALQGQVDKAMAALKDAVESGWADMDHINKDTDFNGIRKDPKFAALLKELAEKIAANSLAHVRELLAAQKPFDFDFALPNLDGKTVSKKDYADKVLIVDFWGTWCPPCRMEIPHFVALHKKYQKAGLEIVGLNYERGDPDKAPELIRTFVKANKISYPCLIGDAKTQQQVPKLEGYPTTLFFDRAGKLRLRVVGYHSLSNLEAIVKVLLDEKQTVRAEN